MNSSAPDLVIRASRVVTPAGIVPAEVYVHQGHISSVTRWDVRTTAPGGPRSVGTRAGLARVIPGGTVYVELPRDEVLLPGLVDTHVHVNEPGRTEWEGFSTATAAAAAGGVTTIIDMPLNSNPPTTDIAALEVKRKAAASQALVDVGFWAGAVPGNENELADLNAAGVFGFKCFMVDSGVAEFPPLDNDDLAAVMQRVAKLGSLLVVHAEDAACIMPLGSERHAEYAGFLNSRPAAAEVAAISRLIKLAGLTGARVHILHLSAADAVPLIADARASGVQITAETCTHYLALTAEQIGPGQTQFKCCPPIRDAANQERLWESLRSGAIGCVVSDHSPSPPELKGLAEGQDSADFGTAWGGISSLQLGLPVVWTKARERGIGLAQVARWMAANPARLVGLPRKGAIEVGRDADLVAFAPDENFVVEPERLLTRHKLTPYAGQELFGVVRRTWLRGAEVDGMSKTAATGELLRCGSADDESAAADRS